MYSAIILPFPTRCVCDRCTIQGLASDARTQLGRSTDTELCRRVSDLLLPHQIGSTKSPALKQC
eukprot:5729222-Pleurochrysis_carterae.AAC.1